MVKRRVRIGSVITVVLSALWSASLPAQTISGLSVTTPVGEGQYASLTGDLIGTPPLTASIDWGDGSPPELIAFQLEAAPLAATHLYLDDDPSGTAEDELTIEVSLTDGGGGEDVARVGVIVLNAAPVLHNLFVTSPVEESGVASLTAAIGDEGVLDSFSILVDWGDGSPQEIYNYPAGATAILETHSYLDDDPSGTGSDAYEVTVTIEDDDTGVDTAALPIEVVNVAPTLHFVSITTPVEAGQPAALSGFFSDPGILDTFTLEVDWGDGSPPEIFPYPAGSTSFGANHSYAFGGVRVIELALRDDDQGSAFDVLEVEVPGDPPPAAVPTLGRAAAGVLVALLLLAAARHRRAA